MLENKGEEVAVGIERSVGKKERVFMMVDVMRCYSLVGWVHARKMLLKEKEIKFWIFFLLRQEIKRIRLCV